MQWLIIAFVALLYVVSSYVSFDDRPKGDWIFAATVMALSTIMSVCWYVLVYITDDKRDLYIYGLSWDLIMTAIFYLTPVLIANLSINRWSIVGLVMMFTGLMVLKFSS